jgi:hypothetical protein
MTQHQIELWLTPQADKNLMQVQCPKEKIMPVDVVGGEPEHQPQAEGPTPDQAFFLRGMGWSSELGTKARVSSAHQPASADRFLAGAVVPT